MTPQIRSRIANLIGAQGAALQPCAHLGSASFSFEPLSICSSATRRHHATTLSAIAVQARDLFHTLSKRIQAEGTSDSLLSMRKQTLGEFFLQTGPKHEESSASLKELFELKFFGSDVSTLHKNARLAMAEELARTLQVSTRLPDIKAITSRSNGKRDVHKSAEYSIVTYFAAVEQKAFQAAVTKDELNLLKDYYSCDPSGELWSLKYSASSLLAVSPEGLIALQLLLHKLNNNAVIGCAPMELLRKGEIFELRFELNTIGVLSDLSGVLIPFLSYLQQRCEASAIVRAEVVLTGPVPKEVLDWIYSGQPETPGPIPYVKILYKFPLPSGASYTTVLKSDRSLTGNNPLPNQSFDDHDIRVIAGVVRSLRLSSQRCDLLADELTLLPPSIGNQSLSLEDRLADSVKRYDKWINGLWDRAEQSYASYIQGGEINRIRRERYEHALRVPDQFAELLREITLKLPALFPHRPAAQLTLQGIQMDTFVQERAEVIRMHLVRQLEQIQRLKPEQLLEYRSKGYRGPVGGYLLPFEVLVLDHCVDFKKVHAFRIRNPLVDQVPQDRRRDLTTSVQWMNAAELIKHIKKAKISREIRAEVSDPLDLTGPYFVKGSLVRDIGFKIGEINFHRAETILQPSRAKFELLGATRRSERLERGILGIAATTREILLRELARSEREIAIASENLSRAAKQLPAKSKRRSYRSGNTNNTALHHEPYEQQLLNAKLRKLLVQERFVKLAELVDQDQMAKVRVRLVSIEDRRAVRFIYGVGLNGLRFAPMELGPAHEIRVTHSQLLEGGSALAVGTCMLATHHRLFHSFSDWLSFDMLVRHGQYTRWMVTQIDNGSGHYQAPASATLELAANEILPEFSQLGIDTSQCALVDVLAPGLQLRSL